MLFIRLSGLSFISTFRHFDKLNDRKLNDHWLNAPPYNDEVVNPHTIRLSGLLRSARNDGDLYRHHSFLQGIFPMPGAYNDEFV